VRSRSERVDPALARADPNHLVHRQHEDLAVADLAGLRRTFDGLDDAVGLVIVDDDLDLHLGKEVDPCTTQYDRAVSRSP